MPNTFKEDITTVVTTGFKTSADMFIGGIIGTGIMAGVVAAAHGVSYLWGKLRK